MRKLHRVAIITAPELIYFLGQQGFTDILTFRDYKARSPGEVRDRLILMTARKLAYAHE